MNWLKNLWSNDSVKSSVYALVKAVITAALATIGVTTFAGCSALTPTTRSQSMSVVGIGLPAIAVVTSSTQNSDTTGNDSNMPTQSNPVTVTK